MDLVEGFSRVTLRESWLENFKQHIPPSHGPSLPKYVFRAAGPNSSGINTCREMKAGVYKNEPLEDIPGFEQIETTAKRRYDRVMLETETTSHFNKYRRLPTGWISTTTSLMRAIQILFVEHRQGGWSKEWKAMWDKAPIRKVGDDAMDAAIKLSAAFRCNDQEFLARKFLSLEFRLDSSTMDESRFLEMIRKQPSPNPRAEYNNFLSLQQDVLGLLSELDEHMRQHPHAVPPKANLDAVSSLLRALGLVIQLALHD
ncbi:MAG: hypothetical protein M1824_002302 [Vezdaea acicularis]|nr:MAG: hypothetical protein M1824_002302 [Vezdaea acicularis]